MTLEHQVIPLPMAQRLKELGVKQSSLFVHDEYPFDPGKSVIRLKETETHLYWNCPSAFTVAELIMAIGMYAFSQKHGRYDFSTGFAIDLDKAYTKLLSEHPNISLGALLIHLLESNLITIEEVNSRI